MRPIYLKMTAFGPYADTQVLEFDKLGKSGLYLITGVSGSGKTMIFDAIAFALYGRPSGNNRETSMFRSTYAKEDTPTSVELKFEYRGELYNVRRNFEYERKKSRGEGTTKEKSGAELIYPDGRVVTKTQEVDRAITEILGIDRSQFSQIAMIAQGDFLKLLLASTDERIKIFQKIFDTQCFSKLQERLKRESQTQESLYRSAVKSIKQYVDGIICEENSALYDILNGANGENVNTTEIIPLLQRLNERDGEKELTYGKKINDMSAEKESINLRLARAEEQQKAEDELNAARSGLSAETEKNAVLLKEKEAAQKRIPQAEMYGTLAAKLEAELPQYKERDEKNELAAKLKETIANTRDRVENGEKYLKELVAEISQKKEIVKGLQNAAAEKAVIDAQKKAAEDRQKSLGKLGDVLSEIDSGKVELSRVQKEYLDTEKVFEITRKEYETSQKLYLDEQAGILAETLAEGVPCPVCGATHHPKKAQKSQVAPTREQLEKLAEDRDRKQQAAAAASEASGKKKAVVEEKMNAAVKTANELFSAQLTKGDYQAIKPRLTKEQSDLSQDLQSLLEKSRAAEDKVKKNKQLQEEIEEAEQLQDKSKKKIDELKKQNTVAETRLKETEDRITQLNRTLKFSNVASAVEEKQKYVDEKLKIEGEVRQAEEAWNKSEKQIERYKSAIETANASLKNREIINKELQKTRLSELESAIKSDEEQLKVVSFRKSSNETTLNNIREKSKEVEKIEERWRFVKNLSDTANGTLNGREKVMLETYVQAHYFDRIIARANVRLMVMSVGQYELKRSETAENNRTKSGLDLDVVDHYNGSVRSVKSLSGGEAFKASLSLALGLSEEIQSSAGGIKLDTMFVDEGFGSLDEESLSQAMKALSSLSEGDRLVGIISHVPAMKEKIDKQIVVTKNRDGGSMAQIIV